MWGLFLTRGESQERLACFEAIFSFSKNSVHGLYSPKRSESADGLRRTSIPWACISITHSPPATARVPPVPSGAWSRDSWASPTGSWGPDAPPHRAHSGGSRVCVSREVGSQTLSHWAGVPGTPASCHAWQLTGGRCSQSPREGRDETQEPSWPSTRALEALTAFGPLFLRVSKSHRPVGRST